MFLSPISLLCLSLFSLVAHVTGSVVVNTEYGPVRGHVVPTFNGKAAANINVFDSIPYARSTAGALRFRAPQKPDSWQDEFVADKIGPACPQKSCCILHYTHLGWNDFSEDCLNVNIYAPSDQRNAPFAVMVWFFPGSFNSGANFMFPGHFLATHDVVVVTVNYRLNAFGFTYTGDDSCDTNVGMLDQVMALNFVKDNIAGFGGDPDRVTIFGESAGGASVGLHTVSPKSQGLFKQAITESGNEFSGMASVSPGPELLAATRRVAAQLQCPISPNDMMMECLRGVPMDDLRTATCMCARIPTLDGPDGFLPDFPAQLIEENGAFQGPLMAGINRDEGSLGLRLSQPPATSDGYNRTQFEALLTGLLSVFETILDDYTYQHIYQAINYNYSPWPHINNVPNNTQAMIDLLTDTGFTKDWDEHAKVHTTGGAPTYAFVFDYRSANSHYPEWMGVPHAAELPLVWGYPLLQLNPEVREDSGIRFDVVNWTYDDILFTLFWQTLYTNFAKFGSPTPEPVDPRLGGGPVTWLPYTSDGHGYLYGSAQPYMAENYRQIDMAFWNNYMPTVLGDSTRAEELKRLLAEFSEESWRGILESYQSEEPEGISWGL